MRQLIHPSHIMFRMDSPIVEPLVKKTTPHEVSEYLRSQGERAQVVEGKHNGMPSHSVLVENPKSPEGIIHIAKCLGQSHIVKSLNGDNETVHLQGQAEGHTIKGHGIKVYNVEPEDSYIKVPHNGGHVYLSHRLEVPEPKVTEPFKKTEDKIDLKAVKKLLESDDDETLEVDMSPSDTYLWATHRKHE
jgi:hypothetical protein